VKYILHPAYSSVPRNGPKHLLLMKFHARNLCAGANEGILSFIPLSLLSPKELETFFAKSDVAQGLCVAVGNEGNISFIPPTLHFPEKPRIICCQSRGRTRKFCGLCECGNLILYPAYSLDPRNSPKHLLL
jgi:hypothetical protein